MVAQHIIGHDAEALSQFWMASEASRNTEDAEEIRRHIGHRPRLTSMRHEANFAELAQAGRGGPYLVTSVIGYRIAKRQVRPICGAPHDLVRGIVTMNRAPVE